MIMPAPTTPTWVNAMARSSPKPGRWERVPLSGHEIPSLHCPVRTGAGPAFGDLPGRESGMGRGRDPNTQEQNGGGAAMADSPRSSPYRPDRADSRADLPRSPCYSRDAFVTSPERG